MLYYNYKGGEKMDIHERMKMVREQNNMTQAEFGKRLGISRDVYANIENDRLKKPEAKEPIIKLICKEFGVSYQWLVNGLGEMNDSDENEAQEIVDSVMTGDNEFAKKVLVAFARMSEEKWKLIREIIEEIESG